MIYFAINIPSAITRYIWKSVNGVSFWPGTCWRKGVNKGLWGFFSRGRERSSQSFESSGIFGGKINWETYLVLCLFFWPQVLTFVSCYNKANRQPMGVLLSFYSVWINLTVKMGMAVFVSVTQWCSAGRISGRERKMSRNRRRAEGNLPCSGKAFFLQSSSAGYL